MLFHSSSDYNMIQISMSNCITDLTEWFSHNSISLNMSQTDITIFFRYNSPLNIYLNLFRILTGNKN